MSGIEMSSRMRFGRRSATRARHAVPFAAVIASHAVFDRRSAARPSDHGEHESDLKQAAATDFATDGDLAAHGLRQHLGNGKTKPGAALGVDGTMLRALEREKNATEIVRVDADAGVLDT